MKRVAMLGNFGLRGKGTMRARALPLARALVERGYQVDLFLPAGRPESGDDHNDHGVAVRYIGPRSIMLLPRLLLDLSGGRYQILHVFKPILLSSAIASVTAILRALHLSKTRLVVDSDDWEGSGGWASFQSRGASLRWLIDLQERTTLRLADAVTTASRELVRLTTSVGVEPRRIHYLPNGATGFADGRQNAASSGDGEVTILLYTRFFEYELERAARVLTAVLREEPGTRLLIVGKGFHGEEDRLLRWLDDEGLSDTTFYYGWLRPEDQPAVFARADLGVYFMDDTLLNRSKCPAKLMEMLAFGLPVVSEAVGEAASYIKRTGGGLLAPAGDERAMSEALLDLIRDSQLRNRLAAAALSGSQRHFDWSHLVQIALRAYADDPLSVGNR